MHRKAVSARRCPRGSARCTEGAPGMPIRRKGRCRAAPCPQPRCPSRPRRRCRFRAEASRKKLRAMRTSVATEGQNRVNPWELFKPMAQPTSSNPAKTSRNQCIHYLAMLSRPSPVRKQPQGRPCGLEYWRKPPPRTPSRNNFDWWGGTPEGVPSHQKTRLYRSNRLIFYSM